MNGRQLASAVAAAPRSTVEGMFERHFTLDRRDLSGSDSGGRWGPEGAYSVLYLGRPMESVIVEAYRHLVEPLAEAGMTGDMVAPRRVVTCSVAVTNVLDLRTPEAWVSVGLTEDDLMSPVGDYTTCQDVGRVAHQLELHGVIAPAATGHGETLALFERHLPADELPTVVSHALWDGLPGDPRRLRIVRGDTA